MVVIGIEIKLTYPISDLDSLGAINKPSKCYEKRYNKHNP